MTVLIPELEAIQKGWEKHILNLKPPKSIDQKDEDMARDYFYAGSWRPCTRRMVEEAIHPSYFPDVDVDLKARFLRGEQREIDMRQALERVGQLSMPAFTVEGQQEKIRLRDKKGRYVISGKKDCAIRWESGARWSVEFKSWSAFLTDRIYEFADLLKSPWTRSASMQLLSYLFGKEEPFGLLVLDRPGLPRLIPVRLEENYELVEQFLRDAELGRDHIEAGTLPPHIKDPAECRRCPIFGSHCQPDVSYDGAGIITDEELLAQIALCAQTAEPRKQYEDVHKDIGDYLKRTVPKTHGKDNRHHIIAGDFSIEAYWQPNTTYPVPENVKKPYRKVDPSGKLAFTITRASEEQKPNAG